MILPGSATENAFNWLNHIKLQFCDAENPRLFETILNRLYLCNTRSSCNKVFVCTSLTLKFNAKLQEIKLINMPVSENQTDYRFVEI